MENRIFGRTWQEIQDLQQKRPTTRNVVDTKKPGDYGADPLGDGAFRMVPSGDVVDFDERNRRLQKPK